MVRYQVPNEKSGPNSGTVAEPTARRYESSHPWIKFELDLRVAPSKFWHLLGEATSEFEHVAGVPLKPAAADSLHRVYLARGIRATTAIEGNTLSEEEVSRRISGDLPLPPSKQYLGQEVDNVLGACDWIIEELRSGHSPSLSPQHFKQLNGQVLQGLDLDDHIKPGQIRAFNVGVGNYRGAPPEDCEHLLARLCDWLNGPGFDEQRGLGIGMAVIKAIAAHLYLLWIHPFADGNGRTARLIEVQILASSGVPSLAAHLLSNHYNETRSEYYRQLDQAGRTGGDPIKFLVYALQGLVDGLKAQTEVIRSQQWDVAWVNYVHERFRDRNSIANTRRRQLLLDMSDQPKPIPRSQVRELSPRMAEAYAGKTSKTLSRDLNVLLEMGLLERVRGKFRARRELILAFLPVSGPAEPVDFSVLDVDETDGQLTLPF